MVQKKVEKLIVITGPTAVGKSDSAVNIAQSIGGEVISADSMQIYKGMDVGTGKITQSEMRGVCHYMLDVCAPDEDYSVGRYVVEAKNCIETIKNNKKIPILCGGTGLYINSLLFNHTFASAPKDEKIREQIKLFAAENGNEKLYAWLKDVDPVSAEQINVNDTKRLVRALEIYTITGKPRGEFKDEPKAAYDYLFIVFVDEREKLYDRINARVDKMVQNGLVDEVKSLYGYKNYNSMQAIGYKEIVQYLDGQISLDDAIEQVKQNSRRYAKRQMTFFRGINAQKHFVTVSQDVDGLINDFLNN
ncbi:MAG: tRNA (adenosine(37)-N6)-dimethylallyltransferase MiaA [Clostridia bacterium]|nr:tRNA (adenosine(37)-N6)-dimethylallyltransferase MiaA [Clostridia bacterium]